MGDILAVINVKKPKAVINEVRKVAKPTSFTVLINATFLGKPLRRSSMYLDRICITSLIPTINKMVGNNTVRISIFLPTKCIIPTCQTTDKITTANGTNTLDTD